MTKLVYFYGCKRLCNLCYRAPHTPIPQKIDTHTPEISGNCKTKTVAIQIIIANRYIICLSRWLSWMSSWLLIWWSWTRIPAEVHLKKSLQQALNPNLLRLFGSGHIILEVPCTAYHRMQFEHPPPPFAKSKKLSAGILLLQKFGRRKGISL